MTSPRLTLSLSVLIALSSPLAFAAEGISKVNGSITVGSGESQGTLETVNGSIKIGDNARVADAETVNGSINVGARSQTGSLETVNGSIRAGTDFTAGGGLETVNGGIFVDRGGTVRGDVETVNGAIGLVDTDVTGGIETVNGDVTVGVNSHVSGGIHYTKPSGIGIKLKPRNPRVVIGPNARVDGPLVFEREVTLYVHATAKTGAIRGATAIAYNTPKPPAE
ncbi:hypothetical protein GLA29479_4024 [Lysobacter antibioticus]|uniref:Polymer-forming cytoskeletal family protein n=1 Tax=Lysobacter antibioticus TaxID=84531 RepID=A0A0S2E237_LYSAN|nr:hypothetical protein [Lysobacter antibioticus]ALN64875.1 hypothetical protein GLA29479_4024 [Lysobacter antibioticus]ALN82720.1 hypothetical protein LA76x_4612 [Lysobacter antibioticus]